MAIAESRLISLQAYGVFLIGFVLRVIAWVNTPVINPDGALFIHQARAIYYGQTDTIFCALNYLSNLPIFIVGSYRLFHDWVFAARSVSFLFGFGTLVPIYLLLKRFFTDRISVLGTMVFAVLPILVGSSVDVIRDPITWFFAALGLYWFTLGLDNKRSCFFVLSSLSLAMAAWARIEASLLIAFSLLFLSFRTMRKKEQAFQQLAGFFIPIVTLAVLGFVAVLAAKGYSSVGMLLDNAHTKITSSLFSHYTIVSEKLANLAFQNRYENFGLFLAEARRNMWLVAFGSVLNRCLEAFFYFSLILCVIGLNVATKRIRVDERIQFFMCISTMLLITMYLHTLRSWYIDYRHICLLIITSSVFMGFGIEKLSHLTQIRFSLKENQVTMVLALLIVALPLPKDLMPRDPDKRVFKEIGEFVANREGTDNFISIATSCSNYRLISFYANLRHPGAPCPVESESTCWEYFSDNFDHFFQHVKLGKIRYFVWSEKLWPGAAGSIFEAPYSLHLKELKRCRHPDTGEMLLYEVMDND